MVNKYMQYKILWNSSAGKVKYFNASLAWFLNLEDVKVC